MHQVLRRLASAFAWQFDPGLRHPMSARDGAEDAEPRPEVDAERIERAVDRVGVERLAAPVGRMVDRLAGQIGRGLTPCVAVATRRHVGASSLAGTASCSSRRARPPSIACSCVCQRAAARIVLRRGPAAARL